MEIGWTFLERAFWGGTYNRELKSLMLGHAFRFVDRVLFVVGENNIRSQKALEKIGAKFLKKAQLPEPDGTMMTNFVFVITRSGFYSLLSCRPKRRTRRAGTPAGGLHCPFGKRVRALGKRASHL